ncbi:MAG: zinc ABC transporter substrate-binding protein [SAR324 cluster bacterium]|nr:zinc ABC transporter substrate-binding protein [SAR324 cluster bacterium]
MIAYRKIISISLILLINLTFSSISNAKNKASDEPLLVIASLPPYASLVKDIGGSAVMVSEVLKINSDPHFFEITPSIIKIFKKAHLFLASGQAYEATIINKLKGLNDKLVIVHLNDISSPIKNDDNSSNDKSNKPKHKHKQQHKLDFDVHTWFSPVILKEQANMIYLKLVDLMPSKKEQLSNNYQQVIGEISTIHDQLTQKLAPYKGKTIFSYHVVTAYFGRDFGLISYGLAPFHVEPSFTDIIKITKAMKKDKANYILITSDSQKGRAGIIAKETNARLIRAHEFRSTWQDTILNLSDKIVEGFTEK